MPKRFTFVTHLFIIVNLSRTLAAGQPCRTNEWHDFNKNMTEPLNWKYFITICYWRPSFQFYTSSAEVGCNGSHGLRHCFVDMFYHFLFCRHNNLLQVCWTTDLHTKWAGWVWLRWNARGCRCRYTQCMGISLNDDWKFDAPQFPEIFRNLLTHLKWLTSRKSLLQTDGPILICMMLHRLSTKNKEMIKILESTVITNLGKLFI